MFNRWLPIIILLNLFPLGHLVRVELTPTVALYPQDLIAGFLSLIIVVPRLFRPKRILPRSFVLALGAFSLSIVLSLGANFNSVTAAQLFIGALYALRWLSYAGVFFYVREFLVDKPLVIREKKYPLLNLLSLAGLALATLGLIQYAAFPDMREFLGLGWDEHFFRLSGPILDPDFMGILLILTWFLLLILPLSKKTRLVTLVMVLAALFLTYSRASYLAWAGGTLVFLGLKRKLKYALVGLSAFVLILFILPKPGGAGVDLTRTFSISSRLVSWQEGIKLWKRQPIFGHGFNLLRYKKQQVGFLPGEFELNHGATGIQNSYLFILATTGVVGLIAFLFLLRSLFQAKTQNPELLATKQASLTALTLHALFTTTWVYPWVILWLWLFLGGSLKKGNTSP